MLFTLHSSSSLLCLFCVSPGAGASRALHFFNHPPTVSAVLPSSLRASLFFSFSTFRLFSVTSCELSSLSVILNRACLCIIFYSLIVSIPLTFFYIVSADTFPAKTLYHVISHVSHMSSYPHILMSHTLSQSYVVLLIKIQRHSLPRMHTLSAVVRAWVRAYAPSVQLRVPRLPCCSFPVCRLLLPNGPECVTSHDRRSHLQMPLFCRPLLDSVYDPVSSRRLSHTLLVSHKSQHPGRCTRKHLA